MSVVADGSGASRAGSLPPPPIGPPAASAAAPVAPPLSPSHSRRAALAGPRSPGDVPTRRRWGRFAAGACLALLGGLLFAALYLTAGSRVEVLVAARDIPPYQTIERDDLRIERVAAEPDVATVDGADLDEMVGRVAATAIPEGAILAADQVYEEGAEVVGPGEVIVGMEVTLAQAPSSLRSGDDVVLGVDPGAGSDAPDLEVEGWLLEKGDRDDDTDALDVSVVVPRSVAVEVGLAAADGRVSLMVTRGG
jgi:hypothetical protein